MDRRLQSSLDKKTRVGWQTRVYRLERGYLSGWADVASAAANQEPSRVICLFQGDQVANLSDQGTTEVQRRYVDPYLARVVLVLLQSWEKPALCRFKTAYLTGHTLCRRVFHCTLCVGHPLLAGYHRIEAAVAVVLP